MYVKTLAKSQEHLSSNKMLCKVRGEANHTCFFGEKNGYQSSQGALHDQPQLQ